MKFKNLQIGIGLKSILLILAFSLVKNLGFAQKIPFDSLYMGQIPPVNMPKIFPLTVNKGSFAAERIVISNDGKDIYYSEIEAYYPLKGASIKKYTYSKGKWNGPIRLFEGFAPALSITGDTMYFERTEAEKNSETYISVKKGSDWSNPKRILNGLDMAHYYQFTNNGNYYISSKSGNGAGLSDWCRLIIKGADTTALSLERPLNTGGENQDFFISKDESFMIVTNRPKLGISYKKNDDNWTNPRNFGPEINFGLGSWGPWVTPDNKYLFYTTGTKPDYSDVYVYWVRIDGAIDSLKNTNLSPYIKALIPNQAAVVGQTFSFTVPENIFFDDDNKVALTYSTQLINGNPIPNWLDFDPATKTFSGIPLVAGELTVIVVVTDSKEATAYCPLKIIITANPEK